FRNSAFASLTTITKQVSSQNLTRLTSMYLSSNRRSLVTAGANIRCGYFDATLIRNQEGVNCVHSCTHISQQTTQKRPRYRCGIDVDYLTGEFNPDFADRLFPKVCLKFSQPFR